jgi:hypothetical protein
MGPAKSQQRKRGPNSARWRKIPKHFASLAYSKRLDFLRGLSAHGYEKEVSMTQTSSTGRGKRRHTYGANPEDLAREVGSLSTLGSKSLKDKWQTLYGAEPPRQISRALMLRAIAYRIQEKSLGGLKPATRRLLMQFAHDGANGSALAAAPSRAVQPGAVLVREWRGISHQVSVLEKGFCFRGERYRSLSEVAREITGTRWSGPLFFGLKRSQEELRNGTR